MNASERMQEDGLEQDKTGVRRSRLINGVAPESVTETNEGATPDKASGHAKWQRFPACRGPSEASSNSEPSGEQETR